MRRSVPSSVAAILACAGGLRAQPTITNMGVLPTGANSTALGVSGDGLIAVGACLIQPGGNRAVRWTPPVLGNLGVASGGDFSLATAISADGLVIVGQSGTSAAPRAFRWVAPGPIVSLGTAPGFTSTIARAVSGDGQIVVGDGGARPFRWTSATGIVDMGTLPGHAAGGAYGANRDGSVVVGYSGAGLVAFPVRWTTSGIESLGLPAGATSAGAYGVNSDGTVVVGLGSAAGGFQRAFRWVEGVGMQDLGLFPGGTSSNATAVSGAGDRVVGAGAAPPGSRAFYWNATIGMVDLNVWLPSQGTDLTGWVLTRATAISEDGTVIVGDGTFNGFSRGWMVNLDPDSDGDGLRDSWEIEGIPYLGAGGSLERYILAGADPQRKDLFVELDAMTGLSLSHAAVDEVALAFANAPLLNPFGPPGVTLHVVFDEVTLPYVPVWQTNGCWPLDFNSVKDAFYGTAAERADPNAAAMLDAKRKAFRYCVVADTAGPKRIGGCGATPGDDFVIFRATLTTPEREAAAFMHELGHNLGLRHGGGDGTNGKPNYPSIMNYVLAYKYTWSSSFWRLDYSRFGPPALNHLVESALNETAGIGTAGGFYSDFLMPFGVNTGPTGTPVRVVRYARLDGSPTDFGNTTGTGFQDGMYTAGVVQDLNYVVAAPPQINLPSTPSPGQTLTAFDDWGNVRLATAASMGATAPAPTFPQDELTVEAIEWIEQNFPVPPQVCYANCDGSTSPPVLNVNDFICFQAKFAAGDSYANCDNSTAAPVLNINDFICFQQKFAAGCP